MNQLDLFAGIGGITLAAEWAGIDTVAFCEKEPFAQSILRKRFPGRPIYSDIFDLTKEVLERDGVTGIDIISGGFPCQPFSNAGKRSGTDDDRYLWPEMCRLIAELRPSWAFVENVDGLVSMAQSDGELILEDETTICTEAEMVIETIRKDLENLGYQSIPVVIPACGVGASHRRYRIFILGYTNSNGDNCEGESGANGDGQTDFQDRSESQRGPADTSQDVDNIGTSISSQDVAHSSCERCSEEREYSERPKERTSSSSAMGDTDCIQLQGKQPLREQSMGRRSAQGEHQGSSHGAGQQRAVEPRLGGSPYEFSDWLDGWGMNPLDALINFIASYPQPALMGQEQHEWEPPRVAAGVKNRAASVI